MAYIFPTEGDRKSQHAPLYRLLAVFLLFLMTCFITWRLLLTDVLTDKPAGGSSNTVFPFEDSFLGRGYDIFTGNPEG